MLPSVAPFTVSDYPTLGDPLFHLAQDSPQVRQGDVSVDQRLITLDITQRYLQWRLHQVETRLAALEARTLAARWHRLVLSVRRLWMRWVKE